MAKKIIIRVGSKVKFVDGDVPEIQKGGIDFGKPGKVVSLGTAWDDYQFKVEVRPGHVWFAKRGWLRKVATKKKRK